MLNQKDYEDDFRDLNLNEVEQQVVLDFFYQLGNILMNNNILKTNQDGLEKETKEKGCETSGLCQIRA